MQTLLISKHFIVLIFQTLMFQCCFFEYLLMSLWRNFDETLMFRINSDDEKSFWVASLRNFYASLLCLWWFAYDSSKKQRWISEDFDANNIDELTLWGANLQNIKGFIAAALMIHWWFFEETMMNNRDFDANIIGYSRFYCVNLLSLEASLMLDCLFVDETLNKHRWDIDNFDANSSNKHSF